MNLSLLYITNIDFGVENGYPEKIIGQLSAFQKSFVNVTLICRQDRRLVFKTGLYGLAKPIGFLGILKLICSHTSLYVRWPVLTPKIMIVYLSASLLRKKIISELPTYPFKQELSQYRGFSYLYTHFSECIFRPLINLLVYRYACVGNETKDTPAKYLFFKNGVSEFQKPCRGFIQDDVLQFVFVGNFGRHLDRFGLDRVLHGLAVYNSSMASKQGKAICLNIVGCNEKELVRFFPNLSAENIICHGYLQKPTLNNLLLKMDFGVGILGFHRVGIFEAAPLKERLYLSNGLSYLSSVIDAELEKISNARILLDANDDMVDFDYVVSEILNRKMASLENKLNNYTFAVRKINWERSMWKIVKAFQSDV